MEFEQHGALIDETHRNDDSEVNEHQHYHKEKSQYRKQKSGNEVAEKVKLFEQLSNSDRSGSETSNDSFAEFIEQHVDLMTYKDKKRRRQSRQTVKLLSLPMPLPVPFKDKGCASLKDLQDLEERVQQVPDSIIDKYAKQIGAIQGRFEELENNTGTAVDIQWNMQKLRTEHEASSNEADRRVRESIKGLRQEMDVKMDDVKRSFVTHTPMLEDSSLPQKVHAFKLQNTQLSSRYEKASQRLEQIETLQGSTQIKLVQKMQQDMDTRLQAIEHKVCKGDLERLESNIEALRQRITESEKSSIQHEEQVAQQIPKTTWNIQELQRRIAQLEQRNLAVPPVSPLPSLPSTPASLLKPHDDLTRRVNEMVANIQQLSASHQQLRDRVVNECVTHGEYNQHREEMRSTMVTTSSVARVERLEAKMVETERKVSNCVLHVEYQQFGDKMMESMAKYVSYDQYQVMREEIQPLSPLPSKVSIMEETFDKLGRGMQSCVTLETVNKVINEQMHTVVATFQGNLQVEANQVLQQVGEAKAILAEAKLEVIENQGIMTNQKAVNSALEVKAAEVVQQVAEARALATEAKLEVTEVRGIRSQIEASITPPPPPPPPPAPVNDHLAEIKTIKAKYEAELTEATQSAQVSAGEASTAAKAASRGCSDHRR